MALETYRRKRDFSRTPEPAPETAPAGGNAFVIQKHDATRLHYDLRLELDGVLKSWAVTKGPSLIPGEKRLAIEVEDHPLSYGDFEGTIPQGEYGGGTVIVWDRGTWTPEGDPAKGLAKGHLRFDLHGEKLNGAFDLVRIKKGRDKQQPWLLIKVDDADAQPDGAPEITDAAPDSVLTGRSITDVAGGVAPKKTRARKAAAAKPAAKAKAQPVAARKAAPAAARKAAPAAGISSPDAAGISGAKPGPLPTFIKPQLASAAAKAPSGKDWMHEIKFDGYRLQARLDHGRVQLHTRNGLDWTSRFGPLAKAIAALPAKTAILDGELVVESANGLTSFAELKEELSGGRGEQLLFYAFDLLHLGGQDLLRVALEDRRQLLSELLAGQAPGGKIRLSETFDNDGATLHAHVCRLGFEGIVSKKRRAPYTSGRSRDWVKVKCALRDEFVVVGFTQSTVSRRAIGSLALATWRGKELAYAGKVGTGFSHKVAEQLWEKLDPLRRADPPVVDIPADADIKGLRWTEPVLVADAEYRTWTASGLLRHTSFQGLRDDKTPDDLREEGLVPAKKPEKDSAEPARWSVKLTHPDRVYWPDAGVSKQGLAEFYADIRDWIAPYITGRPLSLLRCPGGIAECFFQKHAWAGFDAKHIHTGKAGDDEFLWIDDLDGLIALVQAGVLEIHPWGSTVSEPEKPDRLIFDLDPGEGLDFSAVEAAAKDVRDCLTEIGLKSFLKTTGGKGLHVVVPVRPNTDWAKAKIFTQKFSEAVAARHPDRYLTKMSKAARTGRIFLDYLRNGRGQTAVAAYSTRARPGAAVSTPLDWAELGTGLRPAHFTVLNLGKRLAALKADPWADFSATDQKIPPLTSLKALKAG